MAILCFLKYLNFFLCSFIGNDDDRVLGMSYGRHKTTRHHNSPRLARTDALRDPDLCIKPSPKHVRSSLRKVAQDGQDDIFEL